jgi:hypothetical protein
MPEPTTTPGIAWTHFMSNPDKSLALFAAIIEAGERGIPLEEAALKISGSAEAWSTAVDELIDFIGSGEPLEVTN